MKHHLLAFLIIAGAGAAPDRAGGAEPIGQIISLEGEAFADREGGGRIPLRLKAAIYANDRIRTGAASRLQIMFADEAIIMVGEDSEMVMDAFVYDPGVKERNETVMSLLKGIFRVITAKVTDLNPERFEVRTNMASIGIRGCELGFDIRPGDEEFQIVRVPEGKEILVRNHQMQGGNELRIPQQGVQVLLGAGSRLERRALRSKDVLRIRQATSATAGALGRPVGAGGNPGYAAAQASAGSEVAQGQDASDSDVWVEDTLASTGSREAHDKADRLTRDVTVNHQGGRSLTADAYTAPSARPQSVPTSDSLSEAKAARNGSADALSAPSGRDAPGRDSRVAGAPPDARPTGGNGASNGHGNGNGNGLRLLAELIDRLTPEPPPVDYPILGEKTSVSGAAGADWSWGAWGREDIMGEDGGAPDVRRVFGVEASGNVLSPADFQSIAASGMRRVLTGHGSAAASLSTDAQGALLTGPSNIRLSLGQGVSPVWHGVFNLHGDDGTLNFQARGSLAQQSGALNAVATTYSLNAFGQSYGPGSLTRNEVTGNLVGHGGEVTGHVGAFRFEHGGGAVRVDGVYGADLRP